MVIIFGCIDRNCLSNGLKFDGTQLFDVILNKFDIFNFGNVETNC